MESARLFALAQEAAKASYSPYSKFRVGAALLCSDGSVFTGANVENRSFGLTICAERSALVAAVSAGKRDFVGIAIATPDADYPVSPCGACRQVLSEFLKPEAPIVFGSSPAKLVEATVGQLLPSDALHELADR
ncbi:MAG: cytidine deaminase [Spirochaetaceae bacterium]|nr:cytidine deaminase [Spirochaetaceae bacterium]